MNPIDTARRASADHAARHPDAGFYALPGQLRDLGDPWEHLRADAQRQLDRAQVSALLDTAGVPAHADLAERVTMLGRHIGGRPVGRG